MSPRILSRLAVVALIVTLQGCGGCGAPGTPPPEPPPKPVQGNVPPPPAAAAPTTSVSTAVMKDTCAVLVFTNVDEGPAPLVAQLTAEGDCTEGTALFEWDFGDGSPKGAGDTVVHTFEKPGTYTVKGRITSDALPGIEDVDDVEIVVGAPKQ